MPARVTKIRKIGIELKKPNLAEKIKLISLSKQKFLYENKRKNKPYNAYKLIAINKNLPLEKRDYNEVEVPVILCLSKKYSETSSFLKNLRLISMQSTMQVRLHFEKCQKITPPAMLLLLAEVHRTRLLRGNNSITGTYPKDRILLKRMCDTGFFSLLSVKTPLARGKTFPMEYIKFKSGTGPAPRSSRELREGLFGTSITMYPKARVRLQRGVIEAMQNAIEHAYPDNSKKNLPIKRRWWLTGHYHKPSGTLSIMFCDLGVGIPATLPRLWPIEHIRNLASILPGVRPDDGAMIYAGMQIGRSRTHQTERGKGLNDLRYFIDQAQGGELKIYSRLGEYSYTSSNSETYSTNSSPIQGTLIVWTVPFKNITDWTGEDENVDI